MSERTNPILAYLRGLKPMRVALALVALVLVIGAQPPETRVVLHGWQMVPTLLMPVLAPLVFFGLLLDALMGRVMMIDVQGAERARYRSIVWTDLLLAVALVAAWYPYISSLA